MVKISNNSLEVRALWITWENHRRSRELASELGLRYIVPMIWPKLMKIRALRYFFLTVKTLSILYNYRAKIVIAQNPSIILALVVILLKKIHVYRVVIDRHSNFKLHKNRSKLKWKIFELISNYTIRKADLTIVTNNVLADLVNSRGGNAFVLEDKIPEMKNAEQIKLGGNINIGYICGYNEDEPLKEIIDAAKCIENSWRIYVTGDVGKLRKKKSILKDMPNNISFTGFLSEGKYNSLLRSCDVIVVLTKQEYTLTCGAYEGIALGKAMVLSNTETIKKYFKRGIIYVDPKAINISKGIISAVRKKDILEKQICALKEDLDIEWKNRFSVLKKLIFGEYHHSSFGQTLTSTTEGGR